MKKILLLFVLLSTSLSLSAGPIDEARAREIAEAFFADNVPTRGACAIELEWAGDFISKPMSRAATLDNALIYIYTRGDDDGFVIIAGDDNVTPILAYSFDTTFDSENMADATMAIVDAWGAQVKAAREGVIHMDTTTHTMTRNGGELLYDTALWNQGEPYNRETPVIDGSRSVTGCVATALSIICYYHKWPERGVGTTPAYTYTDDYEVTRTVEANTLGRTYNYNDMLVDYNDGYTDTQGNAVAALMKDMGTAVQMMYHPEGSGAYDMYIPKALIDHFSYSKQCRLASREGYDSDVWNDIMRDNLDNFGPTYYSGDSGVGGHAFVVDGYKPGDYFHFNFGWGGISNGYFLFPEIEYYAGQMALLNLEPDRDGSSTYYDNLQLYPINIKLTNGSIMRGITSFAEEYATNSKFTVVIGGYINCGARPFNGDIALVHCDRDGHIKETLYSFEEVDLAPAQYNYYGYYVSVSTGQPIAEGDVLRLYYKSNDSNEWQWAQAYNSDADSEIAMCATPEEIAEELQLLYDKSDNSLLLQLPNAYHVDIDDGVAAGSFQGHTAVSIPSDFLEKGEHIIKISCGGRAYELTLKL